MMRRRDTGVAGISALRATLAVAAVLLVVGALGVWLLGAQSPLWRTSTVSPSTAKAEPEELVREHAARLATFDRVAALSGPRPELTAADRQRRDEAIEALRARVVRNPGDGFAAALLAYLEDDAAAALERLEGRDDGEASWLAQACRRALARTEGNPLDVASTDLDRAVQAVVAAGESSSADTDDVATLVEAALAGEPNVVVGHLLRARIAALRAHHTPAAEARGGARDGAWQELAVPPDPALEPASADVLAEASLQLALDQWRAGEDPTGALKAAIDGSRRAVSLDPRRGGEGFARIAAAHEARAVYRAAQGEDPSADFAAAIVHRRWALEAQPGSAAAIRALAGAHLATAHWRRHGGTEPVAELGDAIAELERLAAADPSAAVALSLAEAHLLRAVDIVDRGRRAGEDLAAGDAWLARGGGAGPLVDRLRGDSQMVRAAAARRDGRPPDAALGAALAAYAAATAADPGDVEAWIGTARARLWQAEAGVIDAAGAEDGREAARRVLALRPGEPRAAALAAALPDASDVGPPAVSR